MKILSRKCSFDGCYRKHHAGGLCHSHDAQLRKGYALKAISFARDVPCSSEGCVAPSSVKGMCRKHYTANRDLTKKLETAHACRDCEVGIAYLKSALCGECKTAKRQGSREVRREVINESHRANKPLCEFVGCDRSVAANTTQTGTLASRLCARHASDASSKTMGVDGYLELMSVSFCEACGSGERLVVDHEHGHHLHRAKMCPECIRGRLCSDCNSALGLLSDSPARVSGLLEYIGRFR